MDGYLTRLMTLGNSLYLLEFLFAHLKECSTCENDEISTNGSYHMIKLPFEFLPLI
jgi:hypothetical protein